MVPQTPATPRPIKIYLDSGDSGPSKDDVVETAEIAAAYRALGFPRGRTSSTSSRPARPQRAVLGRAVACGADLLVAP